MAIDSSVLSPFARADKLEVLEQLTAGRRRVVPLAVLKEIDAGVPDYPRSSEFGMLVARARVGRQLS